MNGHDVADEWLRYASELSPDEEMVKIAIQKAQLVYDFCLKKI